MSVLLTQLNLTATCNDITNMELYQDDNHLSKECQKLMFKNRDKDFLLQVLSGDQSIGCSNSMNDLSKLHQERKSEAVNELTSHQLNPQSSQTNGTIGNEVSVDSTNSVIQSLNNALYGKPTLKLKNKQQSKGGGEGVPKEKVEVTNQMLGSHNFNSLAVKEQSNSNKNEEIRIDDKELAGAGSELSDNFVLTFINSRRQSSQKNIPTISKNNNNDNNNNNINASGEQFNNTNSDSKSKIQTTKDQISNSQSQTMNSIQSVITSFINALQSFKKNRKIKQLSEAQFALINDLSRVESENIDIINNNLYIFRATLLKILNLVGAFMPTSYFRVAWDLFLMINIYLFFFIFSILVFVNSDGEDTPEMMIYCNFMLAIMISDILINLNTAFIEKDKFIEDKILIMKQYFISILFIVDFLSAFVIGSKSVLNIDSISYNPNSNPWSFCFSLLAFSKLYSGYHKAINYENYHFLLNNNQKQFLRLFHQILILVTVAHLASLGWYLVGLYESINNPEQQNWLLVKNLSHSHFIQKYIYSLYWATTTLTTVGYGDIVAYNSTEALYIIVSIFIFIIVFAYTINNVGLILQNYQKSSQEISNKIEVIQKYLIRKSVKPELISRVQIYLKHLNEVKKERNSKKEEQILSTLSKKLSNVITSQINLHILEKFTFFNYFSQKTKSQLPFIMKEILTSPNQVIFEQGDTRDQSIYFIQTGEIQIYNSIIQQNDVQVLHTLSKGKQFGELTFFTENPRSASARCLDTTILYKIERNDFINIIKHNQSDFELFNLMKHSLRFTSNQNTISSMKCFSCGKVGHTVNICPKIHQCFDRQLIGLKYNFCSFQERKQYERLKRKECCAIKKAHCNHQIIERILSNLNLIESTEYVPTENAMPINCAKVYSQEFLFQGNEEEMLRKELRNDNEEEGMGITVNGIAAQEGMDNQELSEEKGSSNYYKYVPQSSNQFKLNMKSNESYSKIFGKKQSIKSKISLKDKGQKRLYQQAISIQDSEKDTQPPQSQLQQFEKREESQTSKGPPNEENEWNSIYYLEIGQPIDQSNLRNSNINNNGQKQANSPLTKNVNTFNFDEWRRLNSKPASQDEFSINITENLISNDEANTDKQFQQLMSNSSNDKRQLQSTYTPIKYRNSFEKKLIMQQSSVSNEMRLKIPQVVSQFEINKGQSNNSDTQQQSLEKEDVNLIIERISSSAVSEIKKKQKFISSQKYQHFIEERLQRALQSDNKLIKILQGQAVLKQISHQHFFFHNHFEKMENFKVFFPQYNYSKVIKSYMGLQEQKLLIDQQRKLVIFKQQDNNSNQNLSVVAKENSNQQNPILANVLNNNQTNVQSTDLFLKIRKSFKPTNISYGVSLQTCSLHPISFKSNNHQVLKQQK